MTRPAMAAILGITTAMIFGAVEAQSPPATSSPSSSTAAPASSSNSSSQQTNGGKDTSRGAKEQQSQKQKCPKNGDNSNVNCKERGKSPK